MLTFEYFFFYFLRAKAATAFNAGHRNSVRSSVCHMGGSVKSGAS